MGNMQPRGSPLLALALSLGVAFVVPSAPVWPAAVKVSGFTEARSPGESVFQVYNLDDGLLSMGITSLAQDKAGVLWVGTDTGAFRFDGRRFHALGSKEGLPQGPETRLWADPRGGIWASNSAGIFRVKNDMASLASEGLPRTSAHSIAWDGRGKLWMALSGGQGLYREADPGTYVKLAASPSPYVVAYAPRNGGMLLVSERGHAELWKEDKVVAAWGAEAGMPSLVVDAQEDGDGRFWILSSLGLWYKDPGKDIFTPFSHPALISGGDRRELKSDGRGGIWVATVHGLLHIFGKRWTLLTDREGMPTKAADGVLVDGEGSLWYAGNGLFRQLGLGAVTNQTTREGLPTEIVWSLCRDTSGRLWAGTNLGLAIQDQGRWTLVPGSEKTAVFSVIALANGGVVASGRPSSVIYVPPGASRASPIPFPLDQRPAPSAVRVIRDRSGNPWVIGISQICRLAPEGNTLVPRERPVTPEARYLLNAFTSLQGRDGTMWFGTLGGLVSYAQGRWKRWPEADGLKNRSLYGLLEAADGTLLVSYYDAQGISRFKVEGDRLRLVRTYRAGREELPSDNVFSIHEDTQGRIWALTDAGAVLVLEDGYRAFGRAQGFLQQDMVQNCFLSEPDGKLWFADAGSLACLDGRAWPWDLRIPPPIFQGVKFGGKPVEVGPSLRIKPGDDSLDLSLGFLSYSRGKAYTFEVRLDGLDRTWRTEVEPRLRYLSLPQGSYILRARAVVEGRRGPQAEFSFSVMPRWHNTWWFRTVLAAALMLATYGLALVRQRQLRAANVRLEATVSERTRELAEASARLEEQSLTDPLTGLNNRRYLAITFPELVASVAGALRTKPGDPPRWNYHPLAFYVIDIDHFKQVNDRYGHEAGDEVLLQMSGLLREAVRNTDSVIRWGGEEFLILARLTGIQETTPVAERIRSSVEAHAFILPDGREIKTTVSIGCVPFPIGPFLPMLPWETAVYLADRGLYAVKRSGRNGWISIQEGPAFAPEPLKQSQGHPDIPPLLSASILSFRTSLPAIDPAAWI
jgi:diguanylate cyclase (GGDEF)-like protein